MKKKKKEDSNSVESSKPYCFAAAAILPLGLMPLLAISSPRFRIGIPTIYSMTKTLLIKAQKKKREKITEMFIKLT